VDGRVPTRSIDLVREFHDAFGLATADAPELDRAVMLRRCALIVEEAGELAAAILRDNLIGAADALIDLQYVLDGGLLEMGLADRKHLLVAAVHEANMAKLWPDGKPRRSPEGKVLKPPGWTAPDLAKIIHQP
jgi:predicted HAD superfamily Cof-like phosphohydrolase